VRLTVVGRYYNFGTVGLTDKAMSDCIVMKGTWKSIAHDSHEWAGARLDYSTRKLRRAMGNEVR